MRKKLTVFFSFVVLLVCSLQTMVLASEPEYFYTDNGVEYYYDQEYANCVLGFNYETEYGFIINDQALIMNGDELDALVPVVSEITEYENIAVLTIDTNEFGNSESYAQAYSDYYNGENNTVLLVDMDCRNVWIYSNGDVKNIITSSKNDIICDNVYKYATDGDYGTCCLEAAEQILTLLRGEKINQPMKYISNICLAVVLALIINFFIMKVLSTDGKASAKEQLAVMKHDVKFTDAKAELKNVDKIYSPSSSDSGGGSSGGGGGGSSGGHGF